MSRSLIIVLWTLLMIVVPAAGHAQENGWPRTLPLEQGTLTIYPLQVDEKSGDVIRFRAALAYRETAGSEPIFGAGWFESRVKIDTSSRVVHPIDFTVTQTRFPAGTDDLQSELSAALAGQSPAWNLDFSLDELEAGLKQAEAESLAAERLNTSPPRIIYRDHPALLISMDGEPVLREIENSPYKAVINTPYPLISDGKNYYLNVARGAWYRAGKATGPYTFESRPPADMVAMVNADEADAEEAAPSEPITASNAPEIVVSTEPAELIVTEGPAAFVPLVDDLLVLQNSDDDVFMHVSSQRYYIVLAGRWYRSASLNGPWDYHAADKLPTAFAAIPQGSNQADSRVYVAGTPEAEEAVLDAYVPQTAAVARGEVDIEVDYDGVPVYQPVDGTDLVYIENTGSTVLLADGLYYLVEDGVWYVSASPSGPWQVATRRPSQVDTILPTSPVHNVKYVQIYDATPDVVYVGYTPGYTGSYVYHNTIVYGSGWYYQPWVSPYYYYPRHSTWGFNVSYNPWSGWNFGLSWGWGPFGVSYYTGGYWHHHHHWHHRHYGRWGPHGYRPRHYARHGRDHGRYAGGGGHRPSPYRRHDNLYRDGRQRARVAETRDIQPRTPVSRDRFVAGRNKDGRIRTEPVSRSELRTKADVRDANFKASQSRLFADNSGSVYRKKTDNAVSKNAISRSSSKAPVKAAKSRTMPSPPAKGTAVSRNDNGRKQLRAAEKKYPASPSRAVKAPPQKQSRVQDPRQVKAPQQKQSRVQEPRQVKAPQQKQSRVQEPRQVKAPQQKQSRVQEPRQAKAPQQKQSRVQKQRQAKASPQKRDRNR